MLKHLFAGCIAAACLFTPNRASAFELGTPAQAHPFRSPQHFALEFRFSPYYPALDDEPGVSGAPFKTAFGDNPRLYFGVELDWQTFRIPYIGTIGPGISVGTTSMSRTARTVSNRVSGDEYGLTIYPMYAAAVLRVDTFWRGAGVPIVPYGKLGLGLGLWRATDGNGTAKAADGTKGTGASWGTQMAIGVSLPLNALDQGAARNMDNMTGINGTYIFAEYYAANLNGLWQENALYVGTSTWAAGLAFEF